MIFKGFKFGSILQLAIGPVCLFIFQTATSAGFYKAEMGVLGVTLVDMLFILAAIFGLGKVINKSNNFQMFLKYFGATVLFLFGLSNILSFFDISIIPSFNITSVDDINNTFIQSLILTLSNPLTILFWAGVFSTKIIEEKLEYKDMLLFGIGAILSTLVFLTVIAFTGSIVNTFISSSMIKILNVIVGFIILGFSLKIVVSKDK